MADNVDPKDSDDEDTGTAAPEGEPQVDEPEAAEAAKRKPPKAQDLGSPMTKPVAATSKARVAKAPKPELANRAPNPHSAQSLGKSMVLFVAVVGGLSVAFALLGREPSGGPRGPSWKVGSTVDIEITLVASDKADLSCAATDEVNGRHCGFEAPNKTWSKSDNTDDKKLFRPYTTTDGADFVAAGLWSEPALSGTLPTERFSVKCKYTVEGKLKTPTFHWGSGWAKPGDDKFAGLISGCRMLP